MSFLTFISGRLSAAVGRGQADDRDIAGLTVPPGASVGLADDGATVLAGKCHISHRK
jgi:hypothetical protein